jgi:hypothetical protein
MNTKSIYVEWIDGSHIQQHVGGFGQDYPRSSLLLLDLEDQSLDLGCSLFTPLA